MLITDEKIKVTEQEMHDEGLSTLLSTGQIGIPHSATTKEPVEWVSFTKMTEPQFDKIEEYFLNKRDGKLS